MHSTTRTTTSAYWILLVGLFAFVLMSFQFFAARRSTGAEPAKGTDPKQDDGRQGSEPPAFDTSKFMGSPEAHPIFGVECAFPKLKFERPVDLVAPRDGSKRLFAVEQDGRIRVWTNEKDAAKDRVFLDLSKQVRREHNEEGMLGLAFHPKFRQNGEFFVFYSVTPRGSRISRFHVSKDDPDEGDPDSEEKLIEYRKPFGNHNGGSLHFGPDGFLYISIGDGGLANDPTENGQNLETLLASILRIDVDRKDAGKNYAIPKDNPFADRGGKVRGEIWAYGLRNPWRIAFDHELKTLWAADVGQDAHEEVNIITRGGNYGWKLREGKHPRDPKAPGDADAASEQGAPLIDPVIEYSHTQGKSITGGVVYRGSRLPQLRGAYVYADFMSGTVWGLWHDGKKMTAHHVIARTSLMISAFGEDEEGELYMTVFDGRIYRLRTPDAEPRPDFPKTLSETGLFRSVKDHEPDPRLVPYEVNVPLWSDGASKDRFLALPPGGRVEFKEQGQWEFPKGTVIVKTFYLHTNTAKPDEKRRLETRLWVHSPRGWDGFSYLWNEEQTDAELLGEGSFTREFLIKTPDGPKQQEWYFPSRADCHSCHTHNASFVLGWNTRQLNRPDPHSKRRNQLERFEQLGLFTQSKLPPVKELEAYPDWDDSKASLEKRSRAYLDANCALCHGPGGFGHAQGDEGDLNFHRSFSEAFPPPEEGDADARPWIQPGAPQQSRLIQRMEARHSKEQMPPLATSRPDKKAIEVLSQWIREMDAKKPR